MDEKIIDKIEEQIKQLPLLLQNQTKRYWDEFLSKPEIAQEICQFPAFIESVIPVWTYSHFVANNSLHSPSLLLALFQSNDILRVYNALDYKNKLSVLLSNTADLSSLMRILRQFRRQEMIRIAWRDLAKWSSLDETLYCLSNLADACISQAAYVLYEIFGKNYGLPMSLLNRPESLITIAVGKLGGQELNFSSDVDLIFCYDKEKEIEGHSGTIDYDTFFLRLTQTLIKVLSEQTAEGFVFRVDTRLRPFGDTGPLVMNYNAMEIYYQAHGREWERYALIKARVISEEPTKFKAMLQRFVYRRYIDYGVIDALRDLKLLMDRETRQRSLENNIKRGAGGIREIEFIVQALQLIRGGKETYLQNNSLLKSLALLEAHQCLKKETVKELKVAYIFFRNLENRLQMFLDQQTQTLPVDEAGQQRLALSMGYFTWNELDRVIILHRKKVRKNFSIMIASHYTKQQQAALPQHKIDDIRMIGLGRIDFLRAEQIFKSVGFEGDVRPLWEEVKKFRQSHKMKLISPIAAKRLDDLFPYLLLEIIACQNPHLCLVRVISVLDAIIRRSAYLSLLLENPAILKRFILLCSQSALIASQLARYPLLLDELLTDPYSEIAKLDDIHATLVQRLLSIPSNDYEEQIECLHQFKQIAILDLAARDVMGTQPLMEVSIGLSNIACAILHQTLVIVWEALVKQYGYPTEKNSRHDTPHFLIVAYGKLGSLELAYSSDLDLVFIYQGDGINQTDGNNAIANSEFYLKLAQRLIHLLTVRTVSGFLYEIDLQLRPSGKAGLLVTNIDAFEEYQYDSAWTWEHQALVRARAITGNDAMKSHFQEIRHGVLTQKRDKETLKNQIIEMRSKMREQEVKRISTEFDVKHGQGGVIDIEFMVQYWVLLLAHDYPVLTKYTDNIRILNALNREKLLGEQSCTQLVDAYMAYRMVIHKTALQNQPPMVAFDELAQHRSHVIQIWQDLFF